MREHQEHIKKHPVTNRAYTIGKPFARFPVTIITLFIWPLVSKLWDREFIFKSGAFVVLTAMAEVSGWYKSQFQSNVFSAAEDSWEPPVAKAARFVCNALVEHPVGTATTLAWLLVSALWERDPAFIFESSPLMLLVVLTEAKSGISIFLADLAKAGGRCLYGPPQSDVRVFVDPNHTHKIGQQKGEEVIEVESPPFCRNV